MATPRYFIGTLVIIALVGFGIASLGRTGRAPQSGQPPNGQRRESAQPRGGQTIDGFVDTQFKAYDGQSVTLRQFAGTPLVINAWASWCPFCVDELPDFAAVQKEFGDQVVTIAINRAEERDAAKQFSDAYQISDDLVFLLDPDDSFYRAIGGFSMPETIFVNRSGEIIEHIRGPMTVETIREKVKRLVEP